MVVIKHRFAVAVIVLQYDELVGVVVNAVMSVLGGRKGWLAWQVC